jgi:hypothetical protein
VKKKTSKKMHHPHGIVRFALDPQQLESCRRNSGNQGTLMSPALILQVDYNRIK